MKCVVYTIFTGDEIEKVDLVVLGVLHNALGPKQDIILVQLLGEKVEHTGVVAGMSGSPVYYEGKLVGALSLKLGIFTKEAIGGVTPIENMLDVAKAPEPPANPSTPASGAQQTNTGNMFSASAFPPRKFRTADQRRRRPISGPHRDSADFHRLLPGNNRAIQ